VGFHDVVFARLAPDLQQCGIGHDLVRGHIGRGPGAALVGVYQELVMVLPGENGVAGLDDRIPGLLLHFPGIGIAHGRGHLHLGEAVDQFGVVGQREP